MSGGTREAGARAGDRRRGRVAALQMLYQWEVGRVPMPEVRRMYWEMDDQRRQASDRIRSFATTLADGTVEHVAEIDPLIEASAEHWRVARMPVMDRLILRLAVYELLYQPDTPPAVVIDEALELAKQFSTPDATRFVNGVLDGVRKRLQPDTSTRV
jgi:transcription antitermination protein NusB